MKKVVVLLLFAAIAASIMSVSCTDNPSVSEVQQPEENLADYTIIFYGHGGGNLDKDIISNLSQFYLAEKGSYEHVKIAAQYKYSTKENLTNTLQLYVDYGMLSQQDYETFLTMGGQTVRTIIDPQQGNEQLVADIYGLPDCEIANPDSLTNFINWAAQACPARKYILILSDHGEGYLPHSDLAMTPSATRTIIQDDGHSSDAFSVFSLAAAIKSADIRPNVIYMDACLMNCIEYQFELKDLCDYIVSSSYLVPGAGGEYTSLVNLLASEQDLEQALVKYCEAAVANWDRLYKSPNIKKDDEGTPVSYYDMTVTRTAQLESFGTKFRQFTDILLDAYQNGGEDVRAAIDNCTSKTLKAHYNQPHYDLPKYLKSIGNAVPTYFSNQFLEEMESAYNNCIVKQNYSEYLTKNNCTVDCSILLGCNGSYDIRNMTEVRDAEGNSVLIDTSTITIYWNGSGEWRDFEVVHFDNGESLSVQSNLTNFTWISTGEATYEQLCFDRTVGWSRWIKANQTEPTSWSVSSMKFTLDPLAVAYFMGETK